MYMTNFISHTLHLWIGHLKSLNSVIKHVSKQFWSYSGFGHCLRNLNFRELVARGDGSQFHLMRPIHSKYCIIVARSDAYSKQVKVNRYFHMPGNASRCIFETKNMIQENRASTHWLGHTVSASCGSQTPQFDDVGTTKSHNFFEHLDRWNKSIK